MKTLSLIVILKILAQLVALEETEMNIRMTRMFLISRQKEVELVILADMDQQLSIQTALQIRNGIKKRRKVFQYLHLSSPAASQKAVQYFDCLFILIVKLSLLNS
jgi:hypothetical protein